MTGRRPWWTASAHAERRPFLIGRAAIVKALRAHFAETDFVEVETSMLQVSPGNETHIHAFGTELRSEEHTSELQSRSDLVCRLLLEKKKQTDKIKRNLDDLIPETGPAVQQESPTPLDTHESPETSCSIERHLRAHLSDRRAVECADC